jgi:hypothetical protein
VRSKQIRKWWFYCSSWSHQISFHKYDSVTTDGGWELDLCCILSLTRSKIYVQIIFIGSLTVLQWPLVVTRRLLWSNGGHSELSLMWLIFWFLASVIPSSTSQPTFQRNALQIQHVALWRFRSCVVPIDGVGSHNQKIRREICGEGHADYISNLCFRIMHVKWEDFVVSPPPSVNATCQTFAALPLLK